MRTPDKELLVEGSDDKYSVIHLVEHFADSDVWVTDARGIDEVFAMIPVVWRRSGLKTLGVMVDADQDGKSRYSDVLSVFARAGVTLPVTIPRDGLICDVGPRRIGVWVMPDNSSPGGLEDFLLKLVPDTGLREHAVSSAESAIAQFGAPVGPTHHEKAYLRTWLAWQEPPGLTLGLAIKKRNLNAHNATAIAFVQWFMKLYELSPKIAS